MPLKARYSANQPSEIQISSIVPVSVWMPPDFGDLAHAQVQARDVHRPVWCWGSLAAADAAGAGGFLGALGCLPGLPE